MLTRTRQGDSPSHVVQPFPTFSEIYVGALKALHGEITAARQSADGKTTG